MKRLMTTVLALALLTFVFAPGSAQAQMRFGGQVSYANDFDIGVGARATFGLDQLTEGLEGIASVDWFFPSGTVSDIRVFEVNGNAVYPIPVEATAISPYAGGGLSLGHISRPATLGGSQTELALNLVGGSEFDTGGVVTPFAELRLELAGYEQLVLTGGVLF